MNLFHDLPCELKDKIFYEVHNSFLKDVHIEIKYGWPVTRRIIYKSRIYNHFLTSNMSNESVRKLNDYLDYRKGKKIYILDNVYYKIDPYAF